METLIYLRCPEHKRNLSFEYVTDRSACPFVRSHFHVASACRKWDGIRVVNGRIDQLKCECGKDLVKFAVKARETETECGDKCTSATGPACECKCKGQNHGIGA